MKNKIKRMIDEKENKIKELREKAKTSESVEELRALNDDVDAIIADLNELKEMYGEIDEPAGGEGGEAGARSANLKKLGEDRGGKKDDKAEAEKRAKAFADSGRMTIGNEEARAVLVSSGKIATPTEVGEFKEGFNTVSSIVDHVNAVDAEGMGAYKVPYEISDAEAAETAGGAAYNESDPTYDFVELAPKTITTISYISKQARKQTPIKYEEKVKKSALNALRKKASSLIVGAVKASKLAQVISVTATTIGPDTLRKIALAYGGDENIAGNAVLYLNKLDLLAFGDVRGANEKKAVYEITPDTSNPNEGIIKDGGLSVKYCLNKNCTALSTATRGAADIPTMLYGNPLNVEFPLFSDYEVAVSEDAEFKKGLLTIRGDAEVDAALTVKDGFVVVSLAKNAE